MTIRKISTAILGGSLITALSFSTDLVADSALPAVYLDDATIAGDVNFSEIKASGFYQGLVERGIIDEEELQQEPEVAEFLEAVDLDIDSLNRIVVNASGLAFDPEMMDINPANLNISGGAELKASLSAEAFNNFISNHAMAEDLVTAERQGYTYFIAKEQYDDEPEFSFGLFDGEEFSVVFFGDKNSVAQSFDKAVAGHGELTASLAAAGPVMLRDSNASILFSLSDEMRELIREGIQEDPMMAGMLQPLANLQTFGIGLKIEDDLDLTIAAQFPSDRDASSLQMSLQGLIGMAMGQAGQMPGGVPGPLEKLEIKADGPILRINTNVTLTDLDDLMENLGPMFQF
ncbi:MAG: hypothetical protein JJT75_09120 [Opitutales bacterium]|nr:hypothetical protein [Opitutales bacterium]MCH8539263.1 hypothetical protein [Opitutales bacterium]